MYPAPCSGFFHNVGWWEKVLSGHSTAEIKTLCRVSAAAWYTPSAVWELIRYIPLWVRVSVLIADMFHCTCACVCVCVCVRARICLCVLIWFISQKWLSETKSWSWSEMSVTHSDTEWHSSCRYTTTTGQVHCVYTGTQQVDNRGCEEAGSQRVRSFFTMLVLLFSKLDFIPWLMQQYGYLSEPKQLVVVPQRQAQLTITES